MKPASRWSIRHMVLGAVVLCGFPMDSAAQRGAMRGDTGAAGPTMRPMAPAAPGGAPSAINPGLRTNGFWGHGFERARYGALGVPAWGYPGYSPDSGYSGDYGGRYEDGEYPIPDAAPMERLLAPEPQRPVHGVVHEYQWPDPNPDPAATFFVATRDGVVWAAVAVCVEGRSVSLTTPDGRAKSIPLDSVDRDLTRRLNEQARLSLWLPAAP